MTAGKIAQSKIVFLRTIYKGKSITTSTHTLHVIFTHTTVYFYIVVCVWVNHTHAYYTLYIFSFVFGKRQFPHDVERKAAIISQRQKHRILFCQPRINWTIYLTGSSVNAPLANRNDSTFLPLTKTKTCASEDFLVNLYRVREIGIFFVLFDNWKIMQQ